MKDELGSNAIALEHLIDDLSGTSNIGDGDVAGIVPGGGIGEACFFGDECDGIGSADAGRTEGLTAVAVQAGGKVDGEDIVAPLIHLKNRVAHRTIDGPGQSGAEERIDDKVSPAGDRARLSAADIEFHRLRNLPVDQCVPFEVGRVSGQQNGDPTTTVVQVAGDGQAVAAIVAAAADDMHITGHAIKQFPGEVGTMDCGVFHENDPGNMVFLDGDAVDLSNLGAGEAEWRGGHGADYTRRFPIRLSSRRHGRDARVTVSVFIHPSSFIIHPSVFILHPFPPLPYTRAMFILLTNDDGIRAPGLVAMYRELVKLGEVQVIAPETVQSATGHGITMAAPLLTQRVKVENAFEGTSVDGRPADCVKLAINQLCGGRTPDLVVSGMNSGTNVGINVIYSGTVAAAIEAAFLGLPAIAVSLYLKSDVETDYPRASIYARQTIEKILSAGLAKGQVATMNVPALKAGQEPRGIRVVRQCTRPWVDTYDRRKDPKGREYFWNSSIFTLGQTEQDTDVAALKEGWITVTPLQFDLTDHELVAKWRERAW